MPNRLLRSWVSSEKVNKLSANGERFFTRLIMVVDDYGCFYADSRLLKANLFPLLLDTIREADILRWMAECHEAGLIVLYEGNKKQFLQIIDFGQRLRQKTLKFPLPLTDDSNMPQPAGICPPHDSNMRPEEKRREVEVEVEEKGSVSHALSNSNLFRQPVVPTIEKVEEAFLMKGGTKEMAGKFYLKHNAVSWFLNGSPITNFNNLVPGFIANWKKNDPSQITNGVKAEPGKLSSVVAAINQQQKNISTNGN
jgi:hypothetical protein